MSQYIIGSVDNVNARISLCFFLAPIRYIYTENLNRVPICFPGADEPPRKWR